MKRYIRNTDKVKPVQKVPKVNNDKQIPHPDVETPQTRYNLLQKVISGFNDEYKDGNHGHPTKQGNIAHIKFSDKTTLDVPLDETLSESLEEIHEKIKGKK